MRKAGGRPPWALLCSESLSDVVPLDTPPLSPLCRSSALHFLTPPLLPLPEAAAAPQACSVSLPFLAIFSFLLVSFFLSFSKGNPGIKELLNQSHKGPSVCHTAVTCESHCSFITSVADALQSLPKAGGDTGEKAPCHIHPPSLAPQRFFSCLRTHIHT